MYHGDNALVELDSSPSTSQVRIGGSDGKCFATGRKEESKRMQLRPEKFDHFVPNDFMSIPLGYGRISQRWRITFHNRVTARHGVHRF